MTYLQILLIVTISLPTRSGSRPWPGTACIGMRAPVPGSCAPRPGAAGTSAASARCHRHGIRRQAVEAPPGAPAEPALEPGQGRMAAHLSEEVGLVSPNPSPDDQLGLHPLLAMVG